MTYREVQLLSALVELVQAGGANEDVLEQAVDLVNTLLARGVIARKNHERERARKVEHVAREVQKAVLDAVDQLIAQGRIDSEFESVITKMASFCRNYTERQEYDWLLVEPEE